MNPTFQGGEASAARRPFSRRPTCYIVNEFEQVRRGGGFLVNKSEQVWGQVWVQGIPCKWEARDEGVPSEQV